MNKIILRYVDMKDRDVFFKALNESWEDNFDFVHYWNTVANEDFETYLKVAPDFAKGLRLPNDHVPCALFFAFNSAGEIVGRTSIRFVLNDYLMQMSGHIGYGVCPTHRRRGYATEILKESLQYVKANLPTIERVLLTCDEENLASVKTIKKNGGMLENVIESKEGRRTMRFWIQV